MLRPGAEVIEQLGGLHSFMAWDGPILTDSGGFQAMSLDGTPLDDGIEFRSIYDGSRHLLTPESAMEVQRALAPDFAVALDFCPALPAPPGELRRAVELSAAWSARCISSRALDDQFLFGVIQGGTDSDLRKESAEAMVALGFDGFSIGGLAVGESLREMLETLEVMDAALPSDRMRYLMGVGDPLGIVEAVSRGVDLFDCVLPTRLARHGTALTSLGRLSVRSVANSLATDRLDIECDCPTCSDYSLGYLRHLVMVGEETGKRALTIHNVAFMTNLMERIRAAIREGRFEAFVDETRALWQRPDRRPLEGGGQ